MMHDVVRVLGIYSKRFLSIETLTAALSKLVAEEKDGKR
jgi:hypothetical protein